MFNNNYVLYLNMLIFFFFFDKKVDRLSVSNNFNQIKYLNVKKLSITILDHIHINLKNNKHTTFNYASLYNDLYDRGDLPTLYLSQSLKHDLKNIINIITPTRYNIMDNNYQYK